MDARTSKAWGEFCGLPAVAPDTFQHKTVEDMVFSAQHEIDLHEEAENVLSKRDIAKLRTFVSRYAGSAGKVSRR